LVIEIDGSQHRTIEGKAYDEIRTAFLESQGLKVIRFSNMKVDNHFDIVCREIDIEVKSRIEELNQ